MLSQKHPLLQTMNYLTSFLHPSKQIFPVVLILFFLIFHIFISVLHSIPEYITTIQVFILHASCGHSPHHKDSWVWVFLSQTWTFAHSFLHCPCDRLTLELQRGIKYCNFYLNAADLLHEDPPTQQVLSCRDFVFVPTLCWEHIFSSHNIGYLVLIKAK